MRVQHRVAIWCGSLLFLGMLMAGFLAANAQKGKNNKYICSETNPGSMCTAATTCGSASSPCVVNIKRRGGTSATSTPDIPKEWRLRLERESGGLSNSTSEFRAPHPVTFDSAQSTVNAVKAMALECAGKIL
jgi:hypothetical protein